MENTIYGRKDNVNFNSVRDNRKSMKEQVHLWNHLADPEEKTLRIIADGYYN